jgi:hypothetical protein
MADGQRRARVDLHEDVLDRGRVRPIAFHDLGQPVGDEREALLERCAGRGTQDTGVDEREPRALGVDDPEPGYPGAGVDPENSL